VKTDFHACVPKRHYGVQARIILLIFRDAQMISETELSNSDNAFFTPLA